MILNPFVIVFILCHFMLGCVVVNGPLKYATVKESEKISYSPIGIPYFLGGHGSNVAITDELSLTAKHVAKFDYTDVIAYHPNCDIAIVKQNNKNKVKSTLGLVYENQRVKTLGWGLLHRVIKGEGKYYFDVNIAKEKYHQNCQVSITNAPVQSGMSGGGVFNQNGELVGIITALAHKDFRVTPKRKLNTKIISIFISTNYLKDWVFDVLTDYYQKPIKEVALSYNFIPQKAY